MRTSDVSEVKRRIIEAMPVFVFNKVRYVLLAPLGLNILHRVRVHPCVNGVPAPTRPRLLARPGRLQGATTLTAGSWSIVV